MEKEKVCEQHRGIMTNYSFPCTCPKKGVEEMKSMLAGLLDISQREREQSEPYKEMFKAGATHEGLLRKIDDEMIAPVLNACQVLEKEFKITNEVYYFLLSLPLRIKVLGKDIEAKEGRSCYVDKVFFLLAKELGNLLQKKERWACENCKTIYGEYVNGCPRCWDNKLSRKDNLKKFPKRKISLVL